MKGFNKELYYVSIIAIILAFVIITNYAIADFNSESIEITPQSMIPLSLGTHTLKLNEADYKELEKTIYFSKEYDSQPYKLTELTLHQQFIEFKNYYIFNYKYTITILISLILVICGLIYILMRMGKLKGSLLYSWEEIQENDGSLFRNFLIQNYGFEWVKGARIDKIDEGRTINVSYKNESLSLGLDKEIAKAILTIDNKTTDEFIVMKENDKLILYRFPKYIKCVLFILMMFSIFIIAYIFIKPPYFEYILPASIIIYILYISIKIGYISKLSGLWYKILYFFKNKKILMDENLKLQRKISENEKTIKNLHSEIQQFTNQNDDYKRIITSLDGKIQLLENRLNNNLLLGEIQQLNNIIILQNTTIRDLHNEIQQLNIKITKHEKIIDENNTTIGQLRDDNQQLKIKITENERTINKNNTTISQLNNDNQELKNRLNKDHLVNQCHNLQIELDEKKNIINELEKEIYQLNNNINDIISELPKDVQDTFKEGGNGYNRESLEKEYELELERIKRTYPDDEYALFVLKPMFSQLYSICNNDSAVKIRGIPYYKPEEVFRMFKNVFNEMEKKKLLMTALKYINKQMGSGK